MKDQENIEKLEKISQTLEKYGVWFLWGASLIVGFVCGVWVGLS